MKKSPFKFLDSFSKEDRDVFFGRDNEIEELHSRVFQSRILVVYGISGTGKSSLINCGLANKFNDSDWLPVGIRRGTNINRSLSDSLKRNMLSNIPDENSKMGILKILRSVYLDHFKPVFLIFDQFEEVFIFGSRSEREEFILTVKKIIDSDIQCRLIFSMREEYLAGFTEFERAIPDFLDNRIRIEKMTRQNAVKAIEGPCGVNRIAVDEGLSKLILEKLNPDNPEVELTYLQVYLDKLFRIASEENEDVSRLTLGHTEKIGDVKDLLGAFLEEQIAQLDDPDAGLVILKSFVSVHGTKHQITEDEVIDYTRTLGKELDRDKVKDLIQKFIKLRILRDKDEQGRYELRHDSLASCIYEKITLVEKELLEIRQFIENSWNNFERRNLYLTSDDLEYIAPYEDKLFLNERLVKFISQSKRIIHKARRRRQNAMIITAAVLIAILSFFTIWAMRERRNAIDQQKIAEQQKNTAVIAMTVADSARKEAVLSKDLAVKNEQIALEARAQSEQAKKEALVQKENALQQKSLAEKLTVESKEQARIATEQRNVAEQQKQIAIEAEATATRLRKISQAQNNVLKSLSVNKDPLEYGKVVVTAYRENVKNGGYENDPVIFEALTRVWTVLDSSQHSVFAGSAAEIKTIAFSGSEVISADLDGTVNKWNSEGKVISSSKLQFSSPAVFVSLSKSGKYLISQLDDGSTLLWENSGSDKFQNPVSLGENKSFFRSVAFDDDEKKILTGSIDGRITVWQTGSSISKLLDLQNDSPVSAVTFCGLNCIAYAFDSGKIMFRDLKNEESEPVFSTNTEKPLCLAWNSSKQSLLSGMSDGSLFLFSRAQNTFSRPARYIVHDSGIDLMAFNADNSLFATAGRDRQLCLYFCDEYFEKMNIAGGLVRIKDLNARVRSVSFTNENKLVTGLSNRNIRIWETSSSRLAGIINGFLVKDSVLTVK